MRVKALVKDPDVTLPGQEASFILARAVELFVETITKDACCCAQQGKWKTLQRDLDNAIEAVSTASICFSGGYFGLIAELGSFVSLYLPPSARPSAGLSFEKESLEY